MILDVVYNHTAEGNQMGPTLSFRGVDNASYYRLVPDNPRYYMDFTGCGNTLNMQHPRVLALLMDSLRYWVTEMHVDGFRFDLASALARELHDVDRLGSFFDTIGQDPVLSQVKLIAEPVGRRAPAAIRSATSRRAGTSGTTATATPCAAYWKGDEGLIGDFRPPLHGLRGPLRSRAAASRTPASTSSPRTTASPCRISSATTASTTKPTAKTIATATTTTCRGITASKARRTIAEINALRAQQKRNMIATLLLSQGVPMLLAGDEMGQTQNGNNNAYCQDNEHLLARLGPDARRTGVRGLRRADGRVSTAASGIQPTSVSCRAARWQMASPRSHGFAPKAAR